MWQRDSSTKEPPREFTIVGVSPPAFFGTDVGQRFDVAIPIGTESLLRGIDSSLGLPTRNWLRIMVRLRPDQTVEAGTATLRGIQSQIREVVLPAVPEGCARSFSKNPLP